MLKRLKYTGYTVAMQEVPDEVSLVINISGCPHKCDGCHSQYLQEDNGMYLSDEIGNILKAYANLISCVCFMGGDQNINELKKINSYCKSLGYKTCIYNGSNSDELLKDKCFDYVKIGSYKKEYGGLDSPTTNQRMYRLNGNVYEDITARFRD